MAKIDDRIAALESKTARHTTDSTRQIKEEAFSRLFAALRAALPTRYPEGLPENSTAYRRQTLDFEHHILSIDAELTFGTLSADYAAILAALSVDDCRLADTTPEQIVGCFAHAYRTY